MIVIDHSMTWIIWPLLLFGLMAMRGSRRWRYSGMWGERDRGDRYSSRRDGFDPEPLLKELEAQRAEMQEMADRLAELENRADFTERLLASPGGAEHES
jgi:hypothetical protein